MATIKDIANRAGVAISTVSNALNGIPVVKPETRQKILNIAEEMNYHPNINAKLMKSRTTKNLGLFLPALNSEYYLRLMQAMYPICYQKGYSFLAHICTTHDNKQVLSEILSANVDAAAILNENLKEDEYTILEQSGVPFVFLDRANPSPHQKISSVLIENEKGIFCALEYLAHSGHKTIGFLRGSSNYDGSSRYEAFISGMHKLHLPIDPHFVLDGYFEEHAAYNAVRAAVEGRREIPEAFLCSNDKMAIGCMKALRDVRVEIPKDVSIIGFDDVERFEDDAPKLTTVRVPIDEIGKRISEELFRLLEDKQAYGRIVHITPELIIRNTTELRFTGEL